MEQIFRVTKIADFHESYADINWKTIYTTNVDDVIEHIYGLNRLNKTYSENPIHGQRDRIPYYKLHGCAIKSPENISFSNMDYISNAASRHDIRFENLTSDLITDNFLFIGTTLSEEWDIDIKCKQSDIFKVTNRVYFVGVDFNEATIRRLSRRFTNLVLIEETTKSFIEKIKKYSMSNQKTRKNRLILNGFKEIKKEDYEINSYLKPDLYLGAEPTWEDIFSNHDVIWESTRNCLKKIEQEKDSRCFLILGKPISGKTTMLYRIGVYFSRTIEVLEYVGENFLDDLEVFVSVTQQDDVRRIILFDDANWVLGRIDRILQTLSNTNTYLVMTVREKEYEKKKHLFDDSILSKIHIVDRINQLTDKDISAYLDKLGEKSFLGLYGADYIKSKESTIRRIRNDINSNKSDPLLNLAFRMKYGKELEERMQKIGSSIADNENYNVKRFAVLLYFLDVIGALGMKLSLFLELYPMTVDTQRLFMLEINDLLISNANSISLKNSEYKKIIIHCRHSEIVRRAMQQMDDEELLHIIEDILKRLDRVYHSKCRIPNSYTNYVLYTMIRSQNVRILFSRVMKSKSKKQIRYISTLYNELHHYYSDYYMYWLHRGISEVKMRDFSKAAIHLEQARSIRGSYSFEIEHVFAMLYLEQAIYTYQSNTGDSYELFTRGIDILRHQIKNKENDAFTIHTFIVKTIQYYKRRKNKVPDEMVREMIEYYYLARKRFDLKESTIRRNMLVSLYRYLKDADDWNDFRLTQDELQYISKQKNATVLQDDILDVLV